LGHRRHDEPIAWRPPAVKAIAAEPDPRKALVLWVRTANEIVARTAPLGAVLTAAADIDPAAAICSPRRAATDCSAAGRVHPGTSRPWTDWPPA